jgi:hypothetical protein
MEKSVGLRDPDLTNKQVDEQVEIWKQETQ